MRNAKKKMKKTIESQKGVLIGISEEYANLK